LRIWQIKEQVVEDPSTKLRLEFSSVYTDEVNAGNEPPLKDELLVLRLWTSDRTRLATFTFERSGRFVHALVEPLPTAPDVVVHPMVPLPGVTAHPIPADLPGQVGDVSFTQAALTEEEDPAGYAHADEIAELDKPTKDEAAFGKAAFTGL
jgi:hypothetical protein